MPVRRGESPTTWRGQCSAPNSWADSRHQVRLVSDRRAPRGRHADLRAPDSAPDSIGVISRGIGAMSISFPTSVSRVIRPTDHKVSIRRAERCKRRFAGTALLLRATEQPLLPLLIVRDAGVGRMICRVTSTDARASVVPAGDSLIPLLVPGIRSE